MPLRNSICSGKDRMGRLARSSALALAVTFSTLSAFASQITLTWTGNPLGESAYVVMRSTNGTTFSQIAVTAPNVTKYVDTGLASSTRYWYKVCGTNSIGNSPFTNIANAVTTAAVPPPPTSSGGANPPTNGVPSKSPAGISSALTAAGKAGTAFVTYTIAGTNAPTSFGATGLPAGLSVNTHTGAITGTPSGAGVYYATISVTNAYGTGSATLVITISPANNSAVPFSRLINISARAFSGPQMQTMIVGFVVADGSKSVLLRGVGPTLASFGVANPLTNPEIELYSGPLLLASDDNWGGTAVLTKAFAETGAFALPAASKDAALLETLAPGAYSAKVSGIGGTGGIVLGEIYDADSATIPKGRLTDVSVRGPVGTGANILVAGFVIEGNTPKQLLIRASGPSLTQFGITGVLTNPELTLYQGPVVIQHNGGWNKNPTLAAAFALVGAFNFTSPADDAILATVQPGSYTIQVSGLNNTTGVALIEIYDMQQ